jgi:hypothetical protein
MQEQLVVEEMVEQEQVEFLITLQAGGQVVLEAVALVVLLFLEHY